MMIKSLADAVRYLNWFIKTLEYCREILSNYIDDNSLNAERSEKMDTIVSTLHCFGIKVNTTFHETGKIHISKCGQAYALTNIWSVDEIFGDECIPSAISAICEYIDKLYAIKRIICIIALFQNFAYVHRYDLFDSGKMYAIICFPLPGQEIDPRRDYTVHLPMTESEKRSVPDTFITYGKKYTLQHNPHNTATIQDCAFALIYINHYFQFKR